jgi:hypothetical protein
MPRHTIDVHVLTHTCSGNPEPHVIETWRSLVDTIPGGNCSNRREISSGPEPTLVDCGRALPPERRCAACSVIITIRDTTITDLGEEPHCTQRTRDGLLPKPCPRCGLPVSALFADAGRHLLCHSARGER